MFRCFRTDGVPLSYESLTADFGGSAAPRTPVRVIYQNAGPAR
jgi:hypothetical protein